VFAAQAERQPSLCPSGAQTFLGPAGRGDRPHRRHPRTHLRRRRGPVADHLQPPARGGVRGDPQSPGPRPDRQFQGPRQPGQPGPPAQLRHALAEQFEGHKELRDHLKSLQRDVQSITDHSNYLSGNITFLLDAALGLINIEQNAIFKIFSVFSVMFLPPTLVAGIYGMNFVHMPELAWLHGYPFALVLMVAAAAGPLLWFKRRGWL
jgi:magnesium transporter